MKYVSIFTIFATGFLGMTAAEEDDTSTMNIAEIASVTSDVSQLYAAIQAAGLEDTLAADGNFTVFAPTDSAFDMLDSALLASLMEDPEALSAVLTYHVLSGTVMSADAPTGVVSTVNGGNLLIVKRNNIRLNEKVKVTTPDIVASNGVIHLIDSVLLPPGNLVDELVALDKFATLNSTVSMFDALVTMLSTGGPYTIFAPTDSAFEMIAATVSSLTEDQIYTVLLHHVVDGNVASFDLEDGAVVMMMSGQNVTIGMGNRTNVNGEIVLRATVDDKFITDYNNMASNGVIHVIEEVLIPTL